MEIHLTPEMEARLDRLVSETGRTKDEFAREAMTSYFDELAELRSVLDRRYDELKSGSVPGSIDLLSVPGSIDLLKV